MLEQLKARVNQVKRAFQVDGKDFAKMSWHVLLPASPLLPLFNSFLQFFSGFASPSAVLFCQSLG